MANAAIIWTFASVIAAACFGRAILMKENIAAAFIWYAVGAAFLLGAAFLWISLEPAMLIQHRIVVAVIGAIFGILGSLAIAEQINPTPPVARPPAPSVGPPAAPPSAVMENNNTVIGTPPAQMGSGNTIVNSPDPQGNVIINRGGTAVGAGACADSSSVAIGAGANAGGCQNRPAKP
jgi:hypothetical protein